MVGPGVRVTGAPRATPMGVRTWVMLRKSVGKRRGLGLVVVGPGGALIYLPSTRRPILTPHGGPSRNNFAPEIGQAPLNPSPEGS